MAWSSLNLGGKEGLRKSFFQLAEEAGIDGELVDSFMLTFHFVHSGFDGNDMANVDQPVVNHIGGQHGRRLVVRGRAGEEIFRRSILRGRGVQGIQRERIRICL